MVLYRRLLSIWLLFCCFFSQQGCRLRLTFEKARFARFPGVSRPKSKKAQQNRKKQEKPLRQWKKKEKKSNRKAVRNNIHAPRQN
uniref:Secreted protein n=1 Tax=Ixodes ricinus TaxID=34613 RepID=A0A0K8R2Q9_IXORI